MTFRRYRPGANAATSLVSLPARNLAASARATCGPDLLGHSLGAKLVAFEVTAP